MTVPTSQGKGEGSKSPIRIMANIFISFIGAGVLGLPYAFKEAGIVEGIVIMSFVGLLSVKAMMLIIDCKYRLMQKEMPKDIGLKTFVKEVVDNLKEDEERLLDDDNHQPSPSASDYKPQAPGKELTYSDVGYYAIGKLGRWLVDLCIITSQISFCCAYLIFMSENLSDYFTGVKMWTWLLILLPPLGLLTLLRTLNSLAISSLFAQMSNLLAFIVVFWFDFDHIHLVNIHPKKMSLRGFPFFLAVSIFCYEGAGMILSLESSVAKTVRDYFRFYFKITMIFVTILYVSFGACGYLSFGSETKDIITLNLPKGDGIDFAMLVKSCLCIALFFTYPVMMFPVVKIIEGKIYGDETPPVWKGNLLRAFFVVLTGIVVLLIPNFSDLLALVGSTFCILLAFILPALFHLKIFKGSATKFDIAINVFLILFGIIGFVMGTWDAICRMTRQHTDVAIKNTAKNVITSTMPALNLTEISTVQTTAYQIINGTRKVLLNEINKTIIGN